MTPSTEAKIKHLDLEAIRTEVTARRRHAMRAGTLGTQSDRGLLEACDETERLLAELRRNRRLLEAGEGLEKAAKELRASASSGDPAEVSVEKLYCLHCAQTVYQEAAKA